jgi:eukaryotic-like serine/threonine-protein kinase
MGSYRCLALLGEGGMGHVYLAEHTRLGRKVALKRLKDRVAAEPEAVEQFMTEARAVNRIHHPHIVDVTDFHNDESGVYYLMELLEGRTLAELLRQEGPLTERRVLYIGHQMADALEAAHKADVLHLDIKPSNIFLTTRDGQADFGKLLDFGLARLREAAGSQDSKDQTVDMGPVTPAFMAPEQASTGPVDHRADIYSLGGVLYAMLAGRPPFEAHSLAEFVHKHQSVEPTPLTRIEGLRSPVSASCNRLVMRCLSKQPVRRPQSAAEVRDLLAKVAESSCGIQLLPGRPPETAIPRRGWGRMRIWASLAVLVIAVAAYFALRAGDESESRQASEGVGGAGTMEVVTKNSPPPTMTLDLSSNPSGAEVFRMDGPRRLLGLTPLRVTKLQAVGVLVVRLTLAGYLDKTLRVDLTRGSQTISAALDRLPKPMGTAQRTVRPRVAGPGFMRPGRRVVSGGGRPSPMGMAPPPVMGWVMGMDTGGTVNPFE